MASHKSLFDFQQHKFPNDFNGKTIAVNPHQHSDLSLDGGSNPDSLLERAVEYGYTHFTLSEHGNLNSAAALWESAEKLKKKGKTIKPFHSVEAYIRFPEDTKDTHLTIGFKTQEAYKCYCRLTPKLFSPEQMVIKFGDVKPVMTVPQLEELAQYGITIGTGCIGSWLNRLVMAGDFAGARKRLEWMIQLVGKENVYDEWIVDDLSQQYVPAEKTKDKKILKDAYLKVNECHPVFGTPDVGKGCNHARHNHVTQRYGIKPIASLDAHYTDKIHKLNQDSKNFGKDWVMSSFQHLKNAGEFAYEAKKNQDLSDSFIEELLDNTHDYADQFSGYKFRTSKDGWLMADFPDNKQWVESTITALNKVDTSDPVYKERLAYEISVFADNGTADFLNYVRQVREVVEILEKNDILINVRGSAGGSLLYYALGISVTDPIKYNLPFERHLTTARIRTGMLPDADIDADDKVKMFQVLRAHYGNRFLPISVDALLKPRSAIKDAERFLYGEVKKETEMLTKMMPTIPQGVDETDWLFGYESSEDGEHVAGFFEGSKELQDYARRYPEVWGMVLGMCGTQRQKSTHSCGCVILPENAENYMPLYRVGGKDGELVTAFNPKGIEYIGAVKYDLLGVTKMNTIKKATELILQNHGVTLPWGEYPHDPAVYSEILGKGDCAGLFQVSTVGIQDLGVRTKAENIADIARNIALYRPSCLGTEVDVVGFKGNMVDYYVAYRNGKVKPKIIHPDLLPIVGDSAGAFVYQEQTLSTFSLLGGMSLEEAEGARRAIGKKDSKVLAEIGGKLKARLIEKGWTKAQADELFSDIMASARYGFNCFAGETLIETRMGLVALGEIVAQPELYEVAYRTIEGDIAYEKPSYGQSMGVKKILWIELADGSIIRGTADHRIWHKGRWLALGEMAKHGSCFVYGNTFNTPVGDFPDTVQHSPSRELGVISCTEETCEVFDITMPTNHNFIIGDGIIAHNCAHSTSYAIVAYNTAYLKLHYPLEFWSAELTCEYDNEDKLRLYAKHLGDLLLPPDIQKSHPTKFLIEEGKLRVPISSIKGVGEAVVENLQLLLKNEVKDLGLLPKSVQVKNR